MSRVNPFAMHRQSFWKEVSTDEKLHLWQPLAALAFAYHRQNGHANFTAKDRELVFLLGQPVEGGWKCAPADQISRAIGRAKKAGWIAAESNSRCLVVPHHVIEGGFGNKYDRCLVHAHRRATSAK